MNANLRPFRQDLFLVIDLDERGWFKGHVANGNGRTVFSFSNEDDNGWPSEDGFWLVEDGFMRHGRDTDGLLKYLQRHAGVAKPSATLTLLQ
jgi:hypothetical protein